MASLISIAVIVVSFFFFAFAFSKAQTVPALYVLGDSLVDVGNNNYINNSVVKANWPYNGIDYPGGIPTGRFSNGKNAADFLAEKVGLPTSPPYLSNTSDVFYQGASFASGGAGIFNTTGQAFLSISITLTQQVGNFTVVQQRLVEQLGATAAQQLLAKSLFAVVIGSNDLFDYFDPGKNISKEVPPQQYVDDMVSTLQGLLKRLHGLGARKFVVFGVGALGCIPFRRRQSSSKDCSRELNTWANKYNQQLTSMLRGLKSELSDINYSYFDTYIATFELIQKPAKYGFREVKAACCGRGQLNADLPCLKLINAVYCPNRTDHIFWDQYHPTQATANVMVDQMFNGSKPYVSPINLKQLIAM